MAVGLLGLKVGMTQVFGENGKVEPVTVIQCGPCPVLQIRTQDRDGYDAVQVGFLDKSREKANRPERGLVTNNLESKHRSKRRSHNATTRRRRAGQAKLPKAECEPQRHIREFRLAKPADGVNVGDRLTVNAVFGAITRVDVIGTTKGRGFTGVMKRHNFSGLPASHGAKKVHRQAGSTSSLASNRGWGRPKKGLRRSGQYGNERVTIRNLPVVKIDEENNLLLVRGSVPGFNGALVMIRPTNKKSRAK